MELSRNLDLYVYAVIISTVFNYVNCSYHCSYHYESGYVLHFFCGAYEYCCGPECCRSHAINFYQIWYFWLMIILMLLLCSGGGWWYRFRYRDRFQNQNTRVSFPGTATPASPEVHIYGAKPYEGPFSTVGPPPPYPTQEGATHSIQTPTYGSSAITQQTPTYGSSAVIQQTLTSTELSPPPPYTGPPPCYADAAGKSSTSN